MQVDVQNTTVLSADGSSIKLGEYSGEVILIVNVASYCGNTAQYEDLQKLHDLYASKGLRILAFPCNDFGCLLYTSPSPRDQVVSRMPSSA